MRITDTALLLAAGYGDISSWVERPGRENDHSTPSGAYINIMREGVLSTPRTVHLHCGVLNELQRQQVPLSHLTEHRRYMNLVSIMTPVFVLRGQELPPICLRNR
jgi:hypothetical protein